MTLGKQRVSGYPSEHGCRCPPSARCRCRSPAGRDRSWGRSARTAAPAARSATGCRRFSRLVGQHRACVPLRSTAVGYLVPAVGVRDGVTRPRRRSQCMSVRWRAVKGRRPSAGRARRRRSRATWSISAGPTAWPDAATRPRRRWSASSSRRRASCSGCVSARPARSAIRAT